MEKPISVGDLVQVVRPQPCCGELDNIGRVFLVASIQSGKSKCRCCGSVTTGIACAEDGSLRKSEEFSWVGFRISRLKRIPPLEELEGVRTEETLKETA